MLSFREVALRILVILAIVPFSSICSLCRRKLIAETITSDLIAEWWLLDLRVSLPSFTLIVYFSSIPPAIGTSFIKCSSRNAVSRAVITSRMSSWVITSKMIIILKLRSFVSLSILGIHHTLGQCPRPKSNRDSWDKRPKLGPKTMLYQLTFKL